MGLCMLEWSRKTFTELRQRKEHQSHKSISTEKAPVTLEAVILSATGRVAEYQAVLGKLQANSRSRLAFLINPVWMTLLRLKVKLFKLGTVESKTFETGKQELWVFHRIIIEVLMLIIMNGIMSTK